MHPQMDGIVESALYVSARERGGALDSLLPGVARFSVISDFGERGCAMNAGTRQVLLLLKKGPSLGIPSPHDGDSEMHVAFAIAAAELPAWEQWLEEKGIPVEERWTWELGGQSLYFRDRTVT
jgi:hypothetical protein